MRLFQNWIWASPLLFLLLTGCLGSASMLSPSKENGEISNTQIDELFTPNDFSGTEVGNAILCHDGQYLCSERIACPADLDENGEVNEDDIELFLNEITDNNYLDFGCFLTTQGVTHLKEHANDYELTDVNSDGNKDLIALSPGYLQTFIANEVGLYTEQPRVFLEWSRGREVVSADITRDGHLDLVFSAYNTHSVRVLEGDGQGSFYLGQEVSLHGERAKGIAKGDLNQDGVIDILVTSPGGGNGLHTLAGGLDGKLHYSERNSVGINPYDVTTGDIDSDGDLDFAVASLYHYQVSVGINQGDNDFDIKKWKIKGGERFDRVELIDFNNDQNLDLLTTGKGVPRVYIYLGDGNGDFTDLEKIDIQKDYGETICQMETVDFNRDAHQDLLLATCQGKMIIYLGGSQTNNFESYIFDKDLGTNPRINVLKEENFDFKLLLSNGPRFEVFNSIR